MCTSPCDYSLLTYLAKVAGSLRGRLTHNNQLPVEVTWRRHIAHSKARGQRLRERIETHHAAFHVQGEEALVERLQHQTEGCANR